MANKRYDEFGAGTYDTAKIFLQADSATGALEKVNLPLPGARYCKFSASVLINANNSGSNPQTAATITLPANTMNAAGDTILIKFFIRYITAAGTKTVTISSAIIDTATVTSTAANQYEFIVFGSRIDSTHMLNYFRATSIDRKSTRLNSSHSQISYAVFCLK